MSIVKIPEHQLDLTNITARIDTAQNDLADLGDQVSVIESKIPAEASDQNQLADKAFVNEEVGKINFVKWVTVLPTTGETKYLYAIAREEQDLEGHYIAALYVWDGSAWRGAGGYSLNINPADFALKTDLDDLGDQVSVIESKIPAEASETNQLADKNYVDSVSSGSGFDFEGTKAEFDAAVAAGTITDDSVSLITDDVSGDNVATKAELQDRVAKAGDTMSGNLNLNAGLIFGNYRDTTARIHLWGVGEGKFYQIVNNSSESNDFLQIYDDQAKGLVLIKSQGSMPYYFNGTNSYRLLTTNDFVNLSTMDYVIESYKDNSGNWYRKYKSGWLEQGGTGDTANKTITFLKPFSDTNYTLVGPGFYIANAGAQNITKTTTGFTTSSVSNPTATSYWEAKGQGAN